MFVAFGLTLYDAQGLLIERTQNLQKFGKILKMPNVMACVDSFFLVHFIEKYAILIGSEFYFVKMDLFHCIILCHGET